MLTRTIITPLSIHLFSYLTELFTIKLSGRKPEIPTYICSDFKWPNIRPRNKIDGQTEAFPCNFQIAADHHRGSPIVLMIAVPNLCQTISDTWVDEQNVESPSTDQIRINSEKIIYDCMSIIELTHFNKNACFFKIF